MLEKDYYLYMPCDGVFFGYNMTLAEAQKLQKKLDEEWPDEAGLSVIGKVSDDYKLAAERAFSHLANY